MPNMRVAVLVDLPREAAAGGHVKYWERLAQAAARQDIPLDLTIYFSGAAGEEILAPHVRYRTLSPVFSTSRLKFLPYVPAHTDLAGFHPALAQELTQYDVIHTTDAYFNFARTAERIASWNKIPLATSFHTDTPAYAELFTRQTLRSLLGEKIGGFVADTFRLPARERAKKEKRLRAHLRKCAAIFAMREADIAVAREVAPGAMIVPMRLAADKTLFTPQKAARALVDVQHGIPPGRFVVLFVGRVDAGKNMPVLLEACAGSIAAGVDLHLLVTGLGPMSDEVKQKLGDRATLAGQVMPEELARFYASADCLAMVSDIEIGGLVGVEALASSCPVLVSRASGAAGLLGYPAAMQEVSSGVEAWREALTKLAQDDARRAKMREDALAFRHDRLADWGDILQVDFMPVWRELARGGANVR